MSTATTVEAKVQALLEEATQALEGSLSTEQVLRELDGWDSMGMVMFIGLVQRNLSVELSVHDLHESETVADLLERVKSKGASA